MEQKKSSHNVALVGMYGGMWREYKPGCFMIGHKTKDELQKHIPDSNIDLYSIDNKKKGTGIDIETVCGIDLRFFGRESQINFLDSALTQYDAIVVGGDIVWGGDDVVEDNDVFFVDSPKFLQTKTPAVLFNCVHTFYDDEGIELQKEKFTRAVERASYVSVRTKAIQERLLRLGLTNIEFVPDPVLDMDVSSFPQNTQFLPTERDKPFMGISIRDRLSQELIDTLEASPFEDFEVVVFPYSRQYRNMETLEKVRKRFGSRFLYFDQYLDPVQSYQFIGELDLFLNDTYHGIIASILYGKPFISLDVEPEITSRKQQLLQTVGISEDYNIRLAYNHPQNAAKMINTIPGLLKKPIQHHAGTLMDIRTQIQKHYDRMAAIIIQTG